MRAGFFNTSPSKKETSHKFEISRESLKGLKKRQLKDKLLELTAAANSAVESERSQNEALRDKISTLEKELQRTEGAAKMAIEKGRQLAKCTIYIGNCDLIPTLADFCKDAGYDLEFERDEIVVVLGSTCDTGGEASKDRARCDEFTSDNSKYKSKYGVRIADIGMDHSFRIKPWYGINHIHLDNVPCEGRKVIGNDAVISTIKEFASRKGEFTKSISSSAAAFNSLADLMNALRKRSDNSDSE